MPSDEDLKVKIGLKWVCRFDVVDGLIKFRDETKRKLDWANIRECFRLNPCFLK